MKKVLKMKVFILKNGENSFLGIKIDLQLRLNIEIEILKMY
jgi:hypothetical protein